MEFINKAIDFLKQWQIKSFTKGACRAMLISFSIAQETRKNGKLEAISYADLASIALSTRLGWNMVEPNIFEYKNEFQRLTIHGESTLVDVVHDLCFIEMKQFILQDNEPAKIRDIILQEIINYYKISDEKASEFITKKMIEGWYL